MHWLTWRLVLRSISDNLKVMEELFVHAYCLILRVSHSTRVSTNL